MPSSSCNWDKFKSSTIYWDNESIKMIYPDIITYSVQNIQGAPYSLSWNDGLHILNNINNYSYEIITLSGINCQSYYVRILYHDYPPSWGVNRVDNFPYTMGPIGDTKITGIGTRFGGEGQQGWLYCNGIFGVCDKLDWYLVLNRANIYDLTILDINYQPISNLSQTQRLKIIDDNITYYYPINDINSITLNYSQTGKTITVNDNKFPLLDENTIRLVCTDPVQEHCPEGTYECDCGDILCCYTPVYWGYQKVKQIPKL